MTGDKTPPKTPVQDAFGHSCTPEVAYRRPRRRRTSITMAMMIAATLAAALLAACGSNSSNVSAGGGSGAVAGKKVTLVHCGDVNPWCAVYNKTIISGLEKEGVKVEYLQDPFDVALEIQNLQTAIASSPDLILISPTDDNSLIPSLQQAKAQNVPVIINNSMPAKGAEDLVTATINADQASLGTFAAQNIVEGFRAQGRTGGNIIAITGASSNLVLKTDRHLTRGRSTQSLRLRTHVRHSRRVSLLRRPRRGMDQSSPH